MWRVNCQLSRTCRCLRCILSDYEPSVLPSLSPPVLASVLACYGVHIVVHPVLSNTTVYCIILFSSHANFDYM